jgi:hypothetical protein
MALSITMCFNGCLTENCKNKSSKLAEIASFDDFGK